MDHRPLVYLAGSGLGDGEKVTLRYGSVCSGIEAATVAWHPLGWQPSFFSEIDAFPCDVLASHYGSNLPGKPIGNGVPNYGDMTKFKDWPDHAIDLLVGGTPCQSFSVAGLRAGLADPRGNLMLTYLALAAKYRPRWVVWENVPGVLSSNGGRDFGTFLRGLGELGYGFAYRVLDAQYVRVDGFERAVPQRRRRVFVVGYLGDWRRAAAVFFDGASLRGNPAPRREAGQGVAPTISSRPTGGGGLGTDFDLDGGLVEAAREWPASVAPTLNAHFGDKQGLEDQHALGGGGLFVAHALRADGFDAGEDGTGRGTPLIPVADTLVSNGDAHSGYRDEKGLVYAINTQVALRTDRAPGEGTGLGDSEAGGPAYTLQAEHHHAVAHGWAVRRLTPTECERLQGFPDGYTGIERKGKHAADGPRYKALGNSMAVNAMRWIGERIQMVDSIE